MARSSRILLNYVCRPSAGHVVEAMRYTRGLYEANSGAEVHLAMSDRSVPEITEGCPWITKTHAVHMDDFDGAPKSVRLPAEWEYIVDDNTILAETDGVDPSLHSPDAAALTRYYRLATTKLTATMGRGTLSPRMRLPDGLMYRPHTRVTLRVPVENQVFARRYAHDGPKIAVLLGSSAGYYKHPDVSSWVKILDAIRNAFPAARFYLTGVRRPHGGKTYTAGYSGHAVDGILAGGADIVDCYDIGTWNQIAMIEGCDALISPNAGFALLALCVGTPLLTIAGGDEVEFFFNHLSFYVVLPDTPDFPYPEEPYLNGKIPCMRPENLDRKIPEIVEGIGLLLDPGFTYPEAIARYAKNISKANVRREYVLLPSSPFLDDF
jgi:hypothetical protein